MNYEEQQKEIEELISQGKAPCSLPDCGGPCDECRYRALEWEKILGEPLIDQSGNRIADYGE